MCGVGWVRAGERVARESDGFFGYGGASGLGVSEVVRPGCALGRVRWKLAKSLSDNPSITPIPVSSTGQALTFPLRGGRDLSDRLLAIWRTQGDGP